MNAKQQWAEYRAGKGHGERLATFLKANHIHLLENSCKDGYHPSMIDVEFEGHSYTVQIRDGGPDISQPHKWWLPSVKAGLEWMPSQPFVDEDGEFAG